MSKVRMFESDEPTGETASPRTTIVGGRPPEDEAGLPPVPTGLQRLLRLASVDEGFRRELVERRGELAAAAGIVLTASEEAILRAVPVSQLEAMIGRLPTPDPARRTFLRQTAASAVMLLGGAALSVSCRGCSPVKGLQSDVPPPPEPQPDSDAGFAEPPPRPTHNEMQGEGGAAPHPPGPRADEPPPERDPRRMQAPGGAAPDLPPERTPDGRSRK